MPLTEVQIRKAKPADKPLKLSDGKGLYLLLTPTGSKLWRWKFRVDGKEKLMTLGSYPELGLAQARARAPRLVGWNRPHGAAQSRQARPPTRCRQLVRHCGSTLVGELEDRPL